MKKYYILLFIAVISLATACTKGDDSNGDNLLLVEEVMTVAEIIDAAVWEVKQLTEEITWKYAYFPDLFSSRQSVTVFEVDLSSKNLSIDFPYINRSFTKTSEAASSVGATVAINGSYFNTIRGGSTTYFKKDGELISETRRFIPKYRENAGFGLDDNGNPVILQKPAAGWASLDYPTLLTSGPMLIADGQEIEQVNRPFNYNRHPRTAIGLTDSNKLLAVVVDGRTSQAHGMSTTELAEFMAALGSTTAMNLDGGGSSTAWVTDEGVVNYPSDNKEFDHEGERGVANAIGFIVEEEEV